ncbi:hypothetical protein X755_29505 [Mesorhizobium sp. LNJC405B00]|nr:hypothetical protein X755_29505 [Mesorhizobium sp. LNJC405B00]
MERASASVFQRINSRRRSGGHHTPNLIGDDIACRDTDEWNRCIVSVCNRNHVNIAIGGTDDGFRDNRKIFGVRRNDKTS